MNEDNFTISVANLEQDPGNAPLGAKEIEGFNTSDGAMRRKRRGSKQRTIKRVQQTNQAKKMKKCIKCGFEGESDKFSKGRNVCYPCRRKYDNTRRKKNAEKHNKRQRELRALRTPERVKREREIHLIYMRETYAERQILITAKKRAKKLSLDFNLEIKDILIPERCPLLGIKIQKNGRMNNRDSSPSIDRINPKEGYVKGNIAIISYRANRIKNDATSEELKLIAGRIDEYSSNTYTFQKKTAN